jgi:hypothetical protein
MLLELTIVVVGPILRIIEFFLFKLVSTKLFIFEVFSLLEECKNKHSSTLVLK